MKKITNLFLMLMLFVTTWGISQTTSSTIYGVVKDSGGEIVMGANVAVTHLASGTKYFSITNSSGYYNIPAVRPGGPFSVRISYVGFTTFETKEVYTSLGASTAVNAILSDDVTSLKEVVISVEGASSFNKDRTGAAQQFSKREVQSIPITGSRTMASITKYNPQGDGRSFSAQDSRLNNFTVDGSILNNGFGLGGESQAGGRTGTTSISLDAVEQLQVNIAPYDVRQSGFVGAGINAVTRSGTNDLEASVYGSYRDNSSKFVGDNAAGAAVVASKFEENMKGFRVGTPIIKDKLFLFVNAEEISQVSPATNWVSTGSPLTGITSRVTYASMETLSNFMKDKFGYITGPWEGFDSEMASKKFLGRLDWNINDNHKLTLRYVHHDSESDFQVSNSSSAGAGSRRDLFTAMSFQNSGYTMMDNTRSAVLELNSKLSETVHNNLIVGYDKQIEDRGYRTELFPTIDIREGGSTYTSVGFDPFTPGNKLDYNNFHITNNITKFIGKHTIIAGVNYEKFTSNNLFFPASNGVYIFNSLADFYTAANQSVANGGAPSTFAPARFQFRYSAIPGGKDPIQPVKSNRVDLYLQDEYIISDKLKVIGGLRVSMIDFTNTALENPAVTAMTFANGEKWNTGVMPQTQYLFEPRFGFNYDIKGDRSTQIRGGTGVFTGKPPYVFLSNQIGNNGILTGFIDVSGTAAAAYGFTANPAQYFTPANPTLPTTFDLAMTDPNYKFPQVWKSNIALDHKLPGGFIGTVEYLYSQNINAVTYYNANLKAPIGTFNGPDNRPRFGGTDATLRVNGNVSMAAILTNTDKGYYHSTTLKIEYPSNKGLWGSFALTFSDAKDIQSAGSIAGGSWQGIKSVYGNNIVGLSTADNNTPNRLVGLMGYRFNYGKKNGGATSFTLGYIGQSGNPFSYVYNGDMNRDGVFGNDLLFVPLKGTDIKFEQWNSSTQPDGTVTIFTIAAQQQAFEDFIKQDKYLSSRRGGYAERNGTYVPILHRIDFSVIQDFYLTIRGIKNSFQVRADILNFGNMLNNDWGVSQRATVPSLLTYRSVGADGIPVFRMGTQLDESKRIILARDTFSKNTSVSDVWSAQISLRYIFGK
ncbi:MAG: carboxypeptidase regulatory-like domain-containing protein [Flavobacteriaceae bacterium]|nr:carboxypeptidase regulatory-like domain-containing protein [Flavobacteriaceae bacterium]